MTSRIHKSAASAARHARRVNISTAGLSGLGTVSAALAQAPWWATVTIGFVSLATTALATVFPQDSADRLSWWQDWNKHRERVHARKHATPRRDRPSTRAAAKAEFDQGADYPTSARSPSPAHLRQTIKRGSTPHQRIRQGSDDTDVSVPS